MAHVTFQLNANQTADNYCKSISLPETVIDDSTRIGMRALPPGGSYTNLTNLAVLHYDGAADANPTTDPTTSIPTSSSPLVETNLHVSCGV